MTRGMVFYTHTAVVALLAGMTAAAAQTAPQPAAPATPQTAAKSDQIETITVTGTKRSTQLEKTPVAISALSDGLLEQEHVQDVQDITQFVPGFAAAHGGDHDVITLTLRGIGNDLAKTEQADPEVSIYVDGVYSPRAEGATSLLYDLDRAEVLRGPQGTLWGRNATGGAVNFITAKPTLDDMHGSLEVGGGSYNAFETRGFVNMPVSDQLAFRIAFADATHDGYVNYQEPPNIPGINRDLYVTGGDKYNGQDQKSARISMLWEPYSNFTWNLSYEYFLDKSPPDLFLNQVVAPGQQLFSALVAIPPQQNRTTNTIRSRMDWDIDDYLSLTYVSGYQWLNGSEDYNQAGGGVAPTSIDTPSAAIQEDRTNYSDYFNYSQELDLKSQGTHTIDWITGLYFFSEKNDIRFDINQFNGTLEGGPGGFNGSFIQPDETENSEAVFGQATWHIDDRFRFTGGARYTRDEKTNNGGLDIGCFGNQANGQPCVALTPGVNPLDVGYTVFSNFNPQTGKNSFSNSGSAQWYRFTWLARGEVDITPTNLAYASVSTGYKSGGLFDGGGRFGPESIINYELGDKAQLFDGRVVWNNSFYYEDFTGFQFSQPLNVFDATGKEIGTSLFTTNAKGDTIGYGWESELAAKVTPDDTVRADFSLMHTSLGPLITENTFIQQAAVLTNLQGNQLPHAPTFSGTLGWDHVFDLANGGDVTTHINTHLETKSFLSVFNYGNYDTQGSYTRTDVSIRYDAPPRHPYSVEFYVQNLEDGNIKTLSATYNNSSPAANGVFTNPVWQAQYMAPRVFGARATVQF